MEPAALAVVRSDGNRLVVAGPGAGKTELLAQRASFLLDTGRCVSPQRILSISFKRDAAKNLQERVEKRCGERSDRFDSLTLDAFAKGIVDRFMPALPEEWRPNARYQVRVASIPPPAARTWMQGAPVPNGYARPNPHAWTNDTVKELMDRLMHGEPLPYAAPGIRPIKQAWGLQWWREQLRQPPPTPSLSFPMLNRLAAYLLRLNPKILGAMRLTYSHVFMDEFQDTTASQWDLVRTAFGGSMSVVTAVGDGKQRIMAWAGAMPDIFDCFRVEFQAAPAELVRNYRSVPELVDIQHVIALALESGVVKPLSASAHPGPGVCAVHEYQSPEEEAADVAALVAGEISDGTAGPRDFCVLVRQLPAKMIGLLGAQLASRGVKMRDESALQDLRAEPVTRIVLASLMLATTPRSAKVWSELLVDLSRLSGLDSEEDASRLEALARAHRDLVSGHLAAGQAIQSLTSRVVDLLGRARYQSTFRQYASGDFLDKVINDLGQALRQSLDAVGEPGFVVDDLLGANVVPAMTIHKSKGLEFGTVIFLGLEDGQWWGFAKAPEEEKRAFFVAFSRAVRRVIFTWSDVRDGRNGREDQSRESVDALMAILLRAGVPTVDRRGL